MKRICFSVGLLCFSIGAYAAGPEPLSLDTCYSRARQFYPLIKQRGLIDKTRDYNISNAAKGYLPQFTINGQATYQSAVTTIPFSIHIPGLELTIPTLSKDQFNTHGEINQTLYEGGVIKKQKELFRANAAIQEESNEVALYALKDRINQLFFGTLLISEQLKLDELVEKDIQNSIDLMQASVNEGAALISSLNQLQAKLLQQQQVRIDQSASRKAYMDMLSLFINRTLDEGTVLETPGLLTISDSIRRPELALYNFQKATDVVQEQLLNTVNRPKISLFGQGGYAMPGLNGFDVNPEWYYIGGVRLIWPLGGYYTQKNQKQILRLDQQTIDVQKDVFLFNTHLILRQQSTDIVKLQQMINKDTEIISKLTEVKNSARTRLENGIVTTFEYVGDLDAEEQARQNLLVHRVQLLLDEYNYKNTSGN